MVVLLNARVRLCTKWVDTLRGTVPGNSTLILHIHTHTHTNSQPQLSDGRLNILMMLWRFFKQVPTGSKEPGADRLGWDLAAAHSLFPSDSFLDMNTALFRVLTSPSLVCAFQIVLVIQSVTHFPFRPPELWALYALKPLMGTAKVFKYFFNALSCETICDLHFNWQ